MSEIIDNLVHINRVLYVKTLARLSELEAENKRL